MKGGYIMVTTRCSKIIDIPKDANPTYLCELNVDTVAELPDKEFNNIILAQGSIALVVQTGEFYVLDGNGNWYNSDGSGQPS